MRITLNDGQVKSDFVQQVERVSGQDLSHCYQCGNCTGTCPVAQEMDLPPTQVIRLLQLGQENLVMDANSMWVCVSCLQCFSHCPKCLDPSSIMEALRRISLRNGKEPFPVEEIPSEFMRRSPQQAIVAGFRKLVP
ncbi:MAG: 4Fe-4S dicluster domain-containing protein [Nitrospiria bacterium]